MSDSTSEMLNLLQCACRGDQEALGKLLEWHRGYLRALAQRELRGQLRARLDASDLVQQTCMSAVRKFSSFEGRGIHEFVAWIRRIHEHNLHDAIREHVGAARRSMEKEEYSVPEWASAMMANPGPTPSSKAMHNEQSVLLMEALDHIPDAQREAIRLRHLEGLTLAEIATEMGRSEVAIAGLLKRGLQSLRKHFNHEDGNPT